MTRTEEGGHRVTRRAHYSNEQTNKLERQEHRVKRVVTNSGTLKMTTHLNLMIASIRSRQPLLVPGLAAYLSQIDFAHIQRKKHG